MKKRPGRGLWGPKSPKMEPRGAKASKKGSQGTPRCPQGGQKGFPDGPKRIPGEANWDLRDDFGREIWPKMMKICTKFVPRGLTYEKCEFSKIIEKNMEGIANIDVPDGCFL